MKNVNNKNYYEIFFKRGKALNNQRKYKDDK